MHWLGLLRSVSPNFLIFFGTVLSAGYLSCKQYLNYRKDGGDASPIEIERPPIEIERPLIEI